MNQSLIVALKNRFPGCKVIASDSSFDVYDGEEHLVAIRKNGAGQFVDQSAEYGCSEVHSLEPIPKDARIFKVIEGKIAHDEKASERMDGLKMFMCKKGRKVLSCSELKARGFEFDEKQRITKSPSQPEHKG
jgi:hypothetical protein